VLTKLLTFFNKNTRWRFDILFKITVFSLFLKSVFILYSCVKCSCHLRHVSLFAYPHLSACIAIRDLLSQFSCNLKLRLRFRNTTNIAITAHAFATLHIHYTFYLCSNLPNLKFHLKGIKIQLLHHRTHTPSPLRRRTNKPSETQRLLYTICCNTIELWVLPTEYICVFLTALIANSDSS
jgi:hypothetical protein